MSKGNSNFPWNLHRPYLFILLEIKSLSLARTLSFSFLRTNLKNKGLSWKLFIFYGWGPGAGRRELGMVQGHFRSALGLQCGLKRFWPLSTILAIQDLQDNRVERQKLKSIPWNSQFPYWFDSLEFYSTKSCETLLFFGMGPRGLVGCRAFARCPRRLSRFSSSENSRSPSWAIETLIYPFCVEFMGRSTRKLLSSLVI